MISVGIDVHKKRCQACLKDEEGNLIEELNFKRDQERIASFSSLLQGYGDAKVALESTGNLWIPLYDSLTENSSNKVILANPRKRNKEPTKDSQLKPSRRKRQPDTEIQS